MGPLAIAIDPEFLLEFPLDCGLGMLPEFNASAKGAHAFDLALIVMDFGCKQSSLAPVQAECLDSDPGGRAPHAHGGWI